MKYKISVIVPIYNIEKYLQDCLDSLASQTLPEIQVLLIDDGSIDSSAEICKRFIESHSNFEYYYKENGGTASARNEGLKHVTGEYIGFVDSDDWIEQQMFETMYKKARESEADILYCIMPGLADYVCPEARVYSGKEIRDIFYPAILPHVTASGTFRAVDWGNCSRIFRTSLVRNHDIQFYEKSRRCEDFAFAVECTLYAKCYRIIDEGELYHYRPNENSKSRSYTRNMWKSIRSLMLYMQKILNGCDDFDFGCAMNFCIFYFCTNVIRNEAKVKNKKERIQKINEILCDSLCMEAVSQISNKGMNKEYSGIYQYVKNRDARGLSRFLERLAWKKKYLYPVSNVVLKNKYIKRVYLKICGK